MRDTPTQQELNDAISAAVQVAVDVRHARSKIRRRTEPGGRREERIKREIAATKAAAKPIRSYLGMLQFHDLDRVFEGAEAKLREASRRLQYERGQLRKMQR